LLAALSRGGFERSFRRKLVLPEAAAVFSSWIKGPSTAGSAEAGAGTGRAARNEDQK
jgi:hypothetical protein